MSKKEKMTCDRIKELLSDYINGDLSAPERALVERHIEVCPSCRKELRKMEKMRSILASYPSLEPPPGFAQRVIAKYYARQRKASFLRTFLLGGLQPKRAFAYAGVALFLVFAIALLSFLPRWTKARQILYPLPTPTLKKAPSIISAEGVGKVLLLPQSLHPDAQGEIKLEIMVYPPSPQERVWLNIALSPGLDFPNGNPFLPGQKEFYIGKLESPVSFSTSIKVLSNGAHWIRVSCITNSIKWAEGFLFLPIGLPSSNYISINQNDIDAISLLSLIAERTGKPIALPVSLSQKLNFSYQGPSEGAIYHCASLLGLTAIKYDGEFVLEIP